MTGSFNVYHWLIVFALLLYTWLLVRIARPKAVVTPSKRSKASLTVQTVFSWLCCMILGAITLSFLTSIAIREPQPIILTFILPLLFALTVRWARSITRKRKAAGVTTGQTI